MRLLQIAVPDDQREATLAVLRDHDLGYTVTNGVGDQSDQTVVNFVAPADAVEHVLDDLVEAGFDRDTYTVAVDAAFAQFDDVDAVQNEWAKTPNRLAPTSLRSKAKDLRANTRSYLWMMVLSAVVAVAGILMGSPAVVVGSMVIAPIVSPALTASVGAVRNDRDMIVDSVHQQALGLGLALVTATAFGWLVKEFGVVPVEIAVEQLSLVSGRLSPSILAIAVGVTAGAAGTYGLATKGQATIVGVMIAAALIPTAGAAGIGIAWGNAVVAVGALLLLVLSLLSVNVGGTAMLFYLDYRPDEVDRSLFDLDSARQAVVVIGTLLLVVATAAGAGYAFSQQSGFERTVNDAVTGVLDDETYRGLGVRSTSIQYVAPLVSDRTEITVTLARTSNESFPGLPDRFDREITDRTGREVLVQVQFVDYAQSGDSPPGSIAPVPDPVPSKQQPI